MSTLTASDTARKGEMLPWQKTYANRLKNPLIFKFFLLAKLPLGFFSGMRVREIDTHHCIATVPYGWMTRNPFRSTYFAALGMAAELSTGALALFSVEKRNPSVAVIIIGLEAEFPKKAVTVTTFTCDEGDVLFAAAERAQQSGQAELATVTTIGRSKDGVEVARFRFTWSYKRRK